MITAKEAKRLAEPIRSERLKKESETIDKLIQEAAQKGETSIEVSEISLDLTNKLLISDFRVYKKELTIHQNLPKTVISWY